jgi:hypothetical protein
MFQDEARFGRMSDLKSCWAPKPIRPIVPMQVVREYVYAFGAVSPKDGRHDSLVLPHANTEAMSMFLEAISGWYPDDYILMFTDQASWHRSKALCIPDNMELGFLPPYSPELNPQEQVWDELREKETANRTFKSLDCVVDAVVKGLQRLESMPDLVASLTQRNWM